MHLLNALSCFYTLFFIGRLSSDWDCFSTREFCKQTQTTPVSQSAVADRFVPKGLRWRETKIISSLYPKLQFWILYKYSIKLRFVSGVTLGGIRYNSKLQFIRYFLLSDQKKVTKEKSPADENCLKLFSLYGKRTRPATAGLKQLFPRGICSNNFSNGNFHRRGFASRFSLHHYQELKSVCFRFFLPPP